MNHRLIRDEFSRVNGPSLVWQTKDPLFFQFESIVTLDIFKLAYKVEGGGLRTENEIQNVHPQLSDVWSCSLWLEIMFHFLNVADPDVPRVLSSLENILGPSAVFRTRGLGCRLPLL